MRGRWLRRDETLWRRWLRNSWRGRGWCVRVRWTVRTDRGSMTSAHSAALDGPRVSLVVLILFPERGRRDGVLALIRVHQVLTLNLLLVLVLHERLCVGAGHATLARTALRIGATVTRRRRHAAVHDDRRGRVILHRVEGRRARRADAGGRLWLWKISVAR